MHRGDHHAGARGDEIHGTTGALDQLTGNDPVCKVAVGSHFEGAEHREVHVPTADHSEGLVAGEGSGARKVGDGLLASVNPVGVHLILRGEGAHTEETVLRLKGDGHTGEEVVGRLGGDTNTEVDVHTVLELEGGTAGDDLAGVVVLGLLSLGGHTTGEGALLDGDLVAGYVDHAVDVDAGEVHLIRVKGAVLDQVLDLGDDAVAGLSSGGVEVASGTAEDEVTTAVALVRLHDGEVTADGLFHGVPAAVEAAGLLGLRNHARVTLLVVLQDLATGLALSAIGSGGVEGRDASTTGTHALSKGTLRHVLELEVSLQVALGEELVHTHIGAADALDLVLLEKNA